MQLGFYVAYTPIWDLPATFPYCHPVTVLEWNSGLVFVLTSVTEPGSLIIHCSIPPRIYKTELLSIYRKINYCVAH